MGHRLAPVALALLLALATAGAFAGVRHNAFLRYDDDAYVTENEHVKAGVSMDGLRWALVTHHHGHWHPLTWLTHMVDVELFGLDAGRHHLSSLALHIVNSVLLLFVLTGMTARPFASAFVAALFALHPLHVESVAWSADRKDLTAGFFWLLGVGAWARYAARPGWQRYGLVVIAFGLGLMSKTVVVTLPVVLLALDYWPLGRFRWRLAVLARLGAEKVPLLAMTGAVALLAMTAMADTAPEGTPGSEVRLRYVADAAIHYVVYLARTAWPQDLAFPYPQTPTTRNRALAAAALLSVITLGVLFQARRRPWLLTGWVWYGVSLLPVIGLLWSGPHSMADRYTYIPLIGIFVIVSWGAAELFGRWRRGSLLAAAAAALALAACAWTSARQVTYWKDTETLIRRAAAVTEGNAEAHDILGAQLARTGALDEAIAHFEEAIRGDPAYVLPYYHLGLALYKQGHVDRAIATLRESLEIEPDNLEVHAALAMALVSKGERRDAIRHLQAVARLRPTANVHVALGKLFEAEGDREEAWANYRIALDLDPRHADALAALSGAPP